MSNKLKKAAIYMYKAKQLYNRCRVQAYSAQAAFFLMFSAVPVIMLSVIVFNYLFPFDLTIVDRFLSEIFVSDVRQNVIKIYGEILSHSTMPLASITTIFLVWAASKGVRSIGSGIAQIYDCTANYNMIQLNFRYAVYTVIMIVISLISVVVLVFTSPLQTYAEDLFGEKAKFILTLINMRNIIFFITFTILFAIAYKFLTRNTLTFFQQIPGAAIASGGWLLFSYGFSIYIKYISHYSKIYGSLGAVMLFMLWLYMCMNILLCGALFNRIRVKGCK